MDDAEFAVLRKQADLGDAEAQCELGLMYLRGENVPYSETNASKWLGRSAEQGLSYARERLHRLACKGVTGARGELKRLANKGDDRCSYLVGRMYLTGSGVERSMLQATEWLGTAARRGNNDALEELERLAEGGSTSALKAIENLVFEIECNDWILYFIGRMYLEGKSVKQSDEEAAVWFTKAAEAGNAEARTKLKEIIRKDGNVPRDKPSKFATACSPYPPRGSDVPRNKPVKLVEKSDPGTPNKPKKPPSENYIDDQVPCHFDKRAPTNPAKKSPNDSQGRIKNDKHDLEKLVWLAEEGDETALGELANLADLGSDRALEKLMELAEEGVDGALSRLRPLALKTKNRRLYNLVGQTCLGEESYEEAAGWFASAARMGDRAALEELAVLAEVGNEHALEELVELADESDCLALRELTRLARQGSDGALEELEMLAEIGVEEAHEALESLAVSIGRGSRRDCVGGFDPCKGSPHLSHNDSDGWLTWAIEVGDDGEPENVCGDLEELAELAEDGFEEAVEELVELADGGFEEAQEALVELAGRGVDGAQDWFERLATALDCGSLSNRIGWFNLGEESIRLSYEYAVEWFALAAERGDEKALRELVKLAAEGVEEALEELAKLTRGDFKRSLGVEKNLRELTDLVWGPVVSLRELKDLVERESTGTLRRIEELTLGIGMYFCRLAGQRCLDKGWYWDAAELLTLAADAGDEEAFWALADLAEEGVEDALWELKKLAEEGVEDALWALVDLAEEGVKNALWALSGPALEFDDPNLYLLIGQIYMSREDIPQPHKEAEAARWFALAAKNGNETALWELRRLADDGVQKAGFELRRLETERHTRRAQQVDGKNMYVRIRRWFRRWPWRRLDRTLEFLRNPGPGSILTRATCIEEGYRWSPRPAPTQGVQTILYRQPAPVFMSILTYDQYFDYVLAQLSSGSIQTVSEICEAVATRTGLTGEERTIRVGTGEATYRNRVRWSLVHLYKAGMVIRVKRGVYGISERGAEALASGERVDRGYLLRFPEYREYVEANKT